QATSRSGTARAAAAPGRIRRRGPFARPWIGTGARIPTLDVVDVAARERAYLRVAGPDAADYLQRMVSNDVEALQVGEACPALLLTAKARLIAPVVVWRSEEHTSELQSRSDL